MQLRFKTTTQYFQQKNVHNKYMYVAKTMLAILGCYIRNVVQNKHCEVKHTHTLSNVFSYLSNLAFYHS